MAAHLSATRLLRRFGAVLALVALFGVNAVAATAATPSTGLLKTVGPFPSTIKAGQYQYVILNADRAALIPALKAANPRLKVLVYKDMAATLVWGSPNIAAGVSMAEANANPEWLLEDAAGNRIEWCDYPGNWQMDVGSRTYQDRWAQNVSADIRANGWDGVFVDDTNASQAAHLCGRTIAKYPTDAAYAAATRSFLANVGPSLTSKGYLVIPNIMLPYSANAHATWVDWISFTSGAMQEYWSKWGTGSTLHFTEADWTYRQKFLSATQKAGKIFIGLTYAPMSDVRSMRYARSTFLLDWDGGPSALLFEAGSGIDPASTDWMSDIGTPLTAARYPVGAAWRRDYTGGTVLVNPSKSSVWVTLDKAYLSPDGSVVSSLALAAGAGVTLRSVGASPAPVTPAPPAVTVKLTGSKVRQSGTNLYWSGLPANTAVDLFRNGIKIAPLSAAPFRYNSYPDRFGRQGRGKYTWQVCVAGTRNCSNTFSLTF